MASDTPDAPQDDASGLARTASLQNSSAQPAAAQIGPWERVKRHKVVEWTLAYVAFAYAALHGAEMVQAALQWPTIVSRLTLIALLVGVPIAATLAYYHGHRARRSVSGLELAILIVLLIVAGSLLWFFSRTIHENTPAAAISQPLTRPASSTPSAFTPPAHSIAVLPFTNLSGDPKQEYFADGMSEELINALTHIDALHVTARASSFSFKGQNMGVASIARKLNVGDVLEGSVRRYGSTVRITVQLTNAVT
jgi:adenylate cyclase